MKPFIQIGSRKVGLDFPPFVIAEIGINHEGSYDKAVQMIDDAWQAGAECVKIQTHVIEDEMVPAARSVIPGNARESIWDIMKRCALTGDEEKRLQNHSSDRGLIFLSTPFSRAAADRLRMMNLPAYKIGSGECNNYPLIDHIASFGKPLIISTGMNNIESIGSTVSIVRARKIPFALLHCTSMYPTPYSHVRLDAINDIRQNFPDAVIGFSDHSLGIYAALGAISLGACILEKHFTSSKDWPGPDVPISIDAAELAELIKGSRAIYEAGGGTKEILPEEKQTIDFAYACVVATDDIKEGDLLTRTNTWVKRPGTGEIKAGQYDSVLGLLAMCDIARDAQISWQWIQKK